VGSQSGAARDGTRDQPDERDRGRSETPARPSLRDLTDFAAASESGLALVYAVLDALVAEFALDDAAIVLDPPGLGRHVFRAHRRPLTEDDEHLLRAAPGLYTRPPLDTRDVDTPTLLATCVLAFRLDLMRYDAWHDPLTGLDDRRSFERLLDMAVARSTRYGWPFTLTLVDLDDLKEINDREGHLAGDAALRELGERFRRALRFGDNAARIGGDEFAMLLPDTAPDQVPALVERIRTAPGFSSPCPSFSYGTAQCPDEADDPRGLFALADERLYEAKRSR
jgi:diguanylate cyclase (GGDEF)-like protein